MSNGREFDQAGAVAANNIAVWDGNSWAALGSGTDGNIYALAVGGSGKLYAGGYVDQAGGTSANYIAVWNGSSSLGARIIISSTGA